ncbi:beta/alpha barrel domain-containing protein [Pedobacter yulinensis]|uniref:hypothetical protein n=1 Tax=Pedobacter yulinensis TaxID=2126353 RepID=UPI0026BA07CE|nr:hypothetical protein [Pedobacter yulinensis]
MQHAVIRLFPTACVRYEFINRGGHVFPAGFDRALHEATGQLARLALSAGEKHYLAETCPYLDRTYLDFLQGYRFDPSEVRIAQDGGELQVVVEGFWYRTILWEVRLLALISELFLSAYRTFQAIC